MGQDMLGGGRGCVPMSRVTCKSADIWLCLERVERKIKQERSHMEREANGSCPSAHIQNRGKKTSILFDKGTFSQSYVTS